MTKHIPLLIMMTLTILLATGCVSPQRVTEKVKLAKLGPAPSRAQVYEAFPPESLPDQPQILSGMPFVGSEIYPIAGERWVTAQVFYHQPLPRNVGLDDLLFDLGRIRIEPTPQDTFTRVRVTHGTD